MGDTSTIYFKPTSWAKWHFEVAIEDGGSIESTAELTIRLLKEQGSITIGEKTIEVARDGMLGKDYHASEGGVALLTARRPKLLSNGYEIMIGGTTLGLVPASAFRREYLLRLGERTVGRVGPVSAFRRSGRAEFPADLPVDIQLIFLWLVLASWKRMSDAAAVS